MEVINTGDDESLRRFISENYSKASLEREPIANRIVTYQAVRAQMGKLSVGLVDPDGEFRVVLVGKSKALGMCVKFTIEVKEEPPHHWAQWTGHPTTPP